MAGFAGLIRLPVLATDNVQAGQPTALKISTGIETDRVAIISRKPVQLWSMAADHDLA